MIFPQNIYKQIIESGKATGENLGYTITLISVIGGVILLYVTNALFGGIVPFWGRVLINLLIIVIIGIFVFRFFIFDENAKKREYETDTDSFAKHMMLQRDRQSTVDTVKEEVTIFEYVDGSSMFCIEMRFGSNSDEQADYTRILYQNLAQLLLENKFECRFVVMPENFRGSCEFKEQIASINRIADPDLAKNVSMINDAILDASIDLCNTDIVYMMGRTTNTFQRYELKGLLRRCINLFNENVTAFRTIHFLDMDEMLEFLRAFYQIPAIDLDTLKATQLAELSDAFTSVVRVLQVKDVNGKRYKVNDVNLNIDEQEI